MGVYRLRMTSGVATPVHCESSAANTVITASAMGSDVDRPKRSNRRPAMGANTQQLMHGTSSVSAASMAV